MSGAQPERGVPRGNFYPGTGVPIRAAKLDQSSSLFANRRRGFLVFLDNSGKASPGLLIWIWLRRLVPALDGISDRHNQKLTCKIK